MSRRIRKSSVLIVVGILSFVVLLWGMDLLAQKTKPRSPLPPYFKDVITKQQDESIRGIQAKYQSQIEKLEAQLKDLRSQREAEMFAILTDAQKTRIIELREEAKARYIATTCFPSRRQLEFRALPWWPCRWRQLGFPWSAIRRGWATIRIPAFW